MIALYRRLAQGPDWHIWHFVKAFNSYSEALEYARSLGSSFRYRYRFTEE